MPFAPYLSPAALSMEDISPKTPNALELPSLSTYFPEHNDLDTSLPPNHIGPVSSSSTSPYAPAVLARTDTTADLPRSSSRANGKARMSDEELNEEVDRMIGEEGSGNGRRRISGEGSGSEEGDWDDWEDSGPTAAAASSGSKAKSSYRDEEDDEMKALEQELGAEDSREESTRGGLTTGGGGGGTAADMEAVRKKLYWRHVAVTGVFVVLWYSFSTCISLYNKWIFGAKYFAFPFPMFMTFCQMIVQFGLAAGVRYTMPTKFKPPYNPSMKDVGMSVTPTGVSTALDIGLSNLSLQTISLSLYTMCKSSTLIFVLLFAFLFHLEAFSLKLIGVITLISSGVFLMSYTSVSADLPGMLMVFSASALGGLRWALTHTLMMKPELGMSNPFATIFWITPIMAVTLAIISMLHDGWFTVFASDFFSASRILATTGYILLPGFLAFSMVACEYYIMQRAGIVPLSVAGVFKEVTTISIASWVFGDEITPIKFIGLAITMIGIVVFSHHKYTKSIKGEDDLHHPPTALNADGIRINRLDDEENVPLTSMRVREPSVAEQQRRPSFLDRFRAARDADTTGSYAPILASDEPGEETDRRSRP